MRRTNVLGYCGTLVALLAGARLEATHPIYLYDLELVPELSTLTVTGGFAGINQTYRVDGQLGLTLDRHPHPLDVVNAQFSLVEATLHSDDSQSFFDGEDLNQFLAMTDWQGLLIDETVLSFTGEDNQDAALITAVAELNDARMRIRGSNLPGCCDFFNYTWDLFALNKLNDHGHAQADFNEDGNVDGDDLVSVLMNFGANNAVHAKGDADADGNVDRIDLAIWRSTLGSAASLYPVSGAPVPEPSGWMIVLLSAGALAWRTPLRRARPRRA
jgi:hypothetical protein